MRKLEAYLREHAVIGTVPGREALRNLLHRHSITFQRTGTWKESNDPEIEAKLEVIDDVLEHHPDRTYAFDEFGPLGIRPTAGNAWAPSGRPDLLPATYHRTAGVTYFHGCYSVGEDSLWGVNHRHKGGTQSLAALKSIRAHAPDGQPVYVILDNLSAHGTPRIRRWAAGHAVQLCFTPTYASWANPIEAHFGVLRQFTLANSNHPNHVVQTRTAARVPALAQRPRPRSRGPGGPAPGTGPGPQREGPPLGPPRPGGGLSNTANQSGHRTSSQFVQVTHLNESPPHATRKGSSGHCWTSHREEP